MRKILFSLALLFGFASQALAADNYNATPGTGLVFGAKDATSVYYPRHILCDNTTVAQCLAIDASGRLTFVPNTAVNIGQINGVTPLMGNGATGTGSPRVTIASDNTPFTILPGNTANTTPWLFTVSQGGSSAVVKAANTVASTDVGLVVAVANTLTAVGNNADNVTPAASSSSPVVNYNYSYDAVGNNWDRVVRDPCEGNAQSYATGVITSATTTRIVAPSASNKTYACMFFVKASAVDNVGVYEGTGGTCGTGKAGVLGGTTTANGLVFGTAGDGLLLQMGGKVAAMQTTGTNVDLCLETSTAGPVIYAIKYVQAP